VEFSHELDRNGRVNVLELCNLALKMFVKYSLSITAESNCSLW